MPYVYCEAAAREMDDAQLQLAYTVQWLSQNLRMPLAPGGATPLHRTGNTLKVSASRLSAKPVLY